MGQSFLAAIDKWSNDDSHHPSLHVPFEDITGFKPHTCWANYSCFFCLVPAFAGSIHVFPSDIVFWLVTVDPHFNCLYESLRISLGSIPIVLSHGDPPFWAGKNHPIFVAEVRVKSSHILLGLKPNYTGNQTWLEPFTDDFPSELNLHLVRISQLATFDWLRVNRLINKNDHSLWK